MPIYGPKGDQGMFLFYFNKFTNELLVNHNLGPPGMMGAKGEKGEPGLAGFI